MKVEPHLNRQADTPSNQQDVSVTVPPQTDYAKTPGGHHIAYQVLGSGPLDLIYVHGISHLDGQWEEPGYAHFFRRLASFSRLILFDMRGTGLSDPVPLSDLPTLEEWMSDIDAVMEAVGTSWAALVGANDGGPMAIFFAASHPDRTSALVLAGTSARMTQDDDYPEGTSPEAIEPLLADIRETWGRPSSKDFVRTASPADADDHVLADWWVRYQKQAASPGTALAIFRMEAALDVRHVLPSIRVPTLVLHGADDLLTPSAQTEYLARHISGARHVELPGIGSWCWRTDDMVNEIQEFLTGVRDVPEPERVLATILFTDIVGSSQRASDLGDRRWRDLLDQHDDTVQRQLERFDGRSIKGTGDGVLATFSGPARAVRCAEAIREGLRRLGLEVTAGVHVGEIELRGVDVGGIAVHIAARVQALARPGEILVSRTVVDLVAGSGIEFEDRGEHELRGVPRSWRLFAVDG
jgi:class 3 adenylate cyclase/pimeloyl-ACP methyl ester carboxylesterase